MCSTPYCNTKTGDFDDGSFPWWGYVLAVFGGLVVVSAFVQQKDEGEEDGRAPR